MCPHVLPMCVCVCANCGACMVRRCVCDVDPSPLSPTPTPGFLSLLASERITERAGHDYRVAVWVSAAVGSLALVCCLALRWFERDFEYDAVQRRRLGLLHSTGPATAAMSDSGGGGGGGGGMAVGRAGGSPGGSLLLRSVATASGAGSPASAAGASTIAGDGTGRGEDRVSLLPRGSTMSPAASGADSPVVAHGAAAPKGSGGDGGDLGAAPPAAAGSPRSCSPVLMLFAVCRAAAAIVATVRTFRARFWAVAVVGMTYYGSILTMVVFARSMFEVGAHTHAHTSHTLRSLG